MSLEEIVIIAFSQATGGNYCWCVRVGQLSLCSPVLFLTLGLPPTLRQQCFAFSLSHISEVWRVLTATDVGNTTPGHSSDYQVLHISGAQHLGGGLQDCWPPAPRLMHSGPSIAAGAMKGNWSVVKSPAAVANAAGRMQAVCLSLLEAEVMYWCGVAVRSTIMGQ